MAFFLSNGPVYAHLSGSNIDLDLKLFKLESSLDQMKLLHWLVGYQQTTDSIRRSCVIIHQRRGYLGEWANADKIDLLVLLLKFRIVRRKVKLLEIDALGRSYGVDEHLTSDTLP
jgi:hypothetical protein